MLYVLRTWEFMNVLKESQLHGSKTFFQEKSQE